MGEEGQDELQAPGSCNGWCLRSGVVRLPEGNQHAERRFAGQGRAKKGRREGRPRQDEVGISTEKSGFQGLRPRTKPARSAREEGHEGEQGEGEQAKEIKAKEIAARTTSRKAGPSPRPIMKWRTTSGRARLSRWLVDSKQGERAHVGLGRARRKRHRAGRESHVLREGRQECGRDGDLALSRGEAGSADGEDGISPQVVGSVPERSFRYTGTVRSAARGDIRALS